MALFLTNVPNGTLVKTIVFPRETKRVELGTLLYIPTYSRDNLSRIVTKLRSATCNFKFRLPKMVYKPIRQAFMLGNKRVIYNNPKAMRDIKVWRKDGFTSLINMPASITNFNGIVDYTDIFNTTYPKTKFTLKNIITIWDHILTDVNPDDTKYLVWTKENMGAHVVTSSSIKMDGWKEKDFYLNFLWQVKFNTNAIIDICVKNNIKIIWTDYKYTYKVDFSDPYYSDVKGRGSKILNNWFMDLRKLRLGTLIEDNSNEEETVATDNNETAELSTTFENPFAKTNFTVTTVGLDNTKKDQKVSSDVEEPDNVDDSDLDILNEVASAATEVDKEFSDTLKQALIDASKVMKKADLDKEVNNILNIINNSKKKSDLIPPRLQEVTNKQNNIINNSISEFMSEVEEINENHIETKEYDSNMDVFNKFRLTDMNKQYRLKKSKTDQMNILSSISKADNPLFLTNVKETKDTESHDSLITKLHVTYESLEDGKDNRHSFTLNIPELRDDKFLYLGNSDKVMSRQKIALPIVRLKNEVVFTTYYNKMFIRPSSGNISRKNYKIKKFIKALRQRYRSNELTWITFIPTVGDALNSNTYSEELVDITRYVSKIDIDSQNYLNLDGSDSMIGKLDGLPYYISNINDDIVSEDKSMKFDIIHFIGELIKKRGDKDIYDLWLNSINGRGTNNIMYAICTAAYAKIPILYIILHALNYNLHDLLDKLSREYSLEYSIIPNSEDVKLLRNTDINNVDDFVFKDFVLRIKYNSISNRVLLSRLLVHDFSELPSLNLESIIMDQFSRIEEINLCNIRDLFIDPISKEVMDSIGIPSDYVGALIYANALLFNYERPVIENSLKYERMPSNEEIIQGTVYKVISHEYADYNKKLKSGVNKNKLKFSVAPDAVIKKIQASPSISESSKLNPVSHVYNNMTVANKGLEGLGVNEDRAYTIPKRLWDKSFYGIISDVSPYNSNTGKNRQLAVNPNITDIRGFFNERPENLKTLDASETMSVSEGLGVFAQKHDSSPRTAMGMSQFNHLMPTEGAEPALVTYGLDETLSYMDSDFVYRAKGSGRIIAMSDKYVKIKYDDPEVGEQTYAFDAIVRNSEKAFYTPNRMIVNDKLKVNDVVDEGTVLSYNSMVYEAYDEDIPIFKSGPIVNVAIAHTQYSYEDSALVSETLANKLASKVIKRIVVKLKNTDKIGEFMEINSNGVINAGDTIIKYLESDGNDLTNIFGDDMDELSDVLSRDVKSHYQGVLRDIYVYYKMTDIQFKHSDKSIKKFINYVEDYYKVNESTDTFRTSRTADNDRLVEHVVSYPVSKPIKINNTILNKGDIMVEFYIEVNQAFSTGDKITFGNSALKGVCSKVLRDEERPYGAVTGRKVDAIISPISPLARMVYSFFLNGILSECVRKANDDILDIINNS